jgi:hypothetical protein
MSPVHQTTITQVDKGQGPVALKPGQTIVIGRKWWGMCARCDKPVIGSAHFCLPDDG